MELEFEVKLVAAIESCFVSLPLALIQTLHSSQPRAAAGFSSGVLVLELRSTSSDRRWSVAWSGDASSSSSIEIARRFAECISLEDRSRVQVRAHSNVEKASLVTIEPNSEDDWEVLELNAELAEAAILKQIRVVNENMTFPLWLHGHATITFRVISTFPKKAQVQLVAGTEVAVAPKRRKLVGSHQDSSKKSRNTARALLRIQDADESLIQKINLESVELRVVLTCVALVHSETGKELGLDSNQLVRILPRLNSKDPNNDGVGMKASSNSKGVTKQEGREVIVHLLFSESVAKGHVMIAQSLRLYLRAGVHSWVYLKGCNDPRKDTPLLSLSPCHFKFSEKARNLEKNDLEVNKAKELFSNPSSTTYLDVTDWSTHDKVVAAFSQESSASKVDYGKGLQNLVKAWFLAQVHAISLRTVAEIKSLFLGNVTLVHFEVRGFSSGYQEDRTTKLPFEILYALGIAEESSLYELEFDEMIKGQNSLLEKLELGDPVTFDCAKERIYRGDVTSDISSLSWMGTSASDVIDRMVVLLSPASASWFSSYDLPFPGHVLIYGPPGSGKTLLARAVGKYLQERKDILAHIVFVSCSKLAVEKAPSIRQAISGYITEALNNAPSLVVFDDLDTIISSSSESEGSNSLSPITALTDFLTDIIDELGQKRKNACGIGNLAFVASAQSLESLPQPLSSSGRFDFHAQLPAPAASQREAILKHEIQKRCLQCSESIVQDVASKCDAYDAYDLEILVDRTVHAAVGRHLAREASFDKNEKPTLLADDFSHAMHGFLPIAMREITKSAPDSGRSGWDDVGGLIDIQKTIKEIIELPLKFPKVFAQAPLRLRSNALLYGPPGCGKTHIVGAAAAACSLRFISVKGPELLNKYIGASEQAVRDIFAKAAGAAPCLLFFDEFDSIAPKRGHDNTGVTDRVVNQFLTELDGVEVLTGVFVFAATSRPDLLDAALLRPGRLDRLLFCDFPSPRERLDILTVLSRKLPVASDVDLDAIACVTEGFSGADLQALLSDAQLEAVHDILAGDVTHDVGKKPIITDSLLKATASKARPSVSDAEKQRLYGIYTQFSDSKRSLNAQTRDAKGKRATLA